MRWGGDGGEAGVDEGGPAVRGDEGVEGTVGEGEVAEEGCGGGVGDYLGEELGRERVELGGLLGGRHVPCLCDFLGVYQCSKY